MSIIVNMVFSKEYIRNFAIALSEEKDALRFRKRDKLNSIIRSYIEVAPKDYKPKLYPDAIKVIVPINAQYRCYPPSEILPERNYKLLEREFEDLFFTMFHRIDTAGLFANGTRKEAREKFLAMCNITSEAISQDAFRKLFDRFREKKEFQIYDFLENVDFDLLTYYKSGFKKYHT